tara:strand:+ start:221 stop:562 length:342 start_codon:yes stop_codon:yes gene_type:complete
MATLLLVQGDTKSQVQATLTRADDGSVVDLNTASSVVMRFRAEDTTTILATLTGSQATSGDFTNGIVTFEFTGTDLNVDAGNYEGEIEVTYSADSTKETVFEVIHFLLREDFA